MNQFFMSAFVVAAVAASGVQAMPVQPHARTGLQLVADGCGPGFHRNDDDECRPDRRPGVGGYFGGPRLLGYRCPPGFHFGQHSGECRPNRRDDD